MENLRNKNEVTSLELLEEINKYREMEYNYKVENNLKLGKVELRNGKFTELRHDTLINIIRDEFEEDITNQKILESEYKDSTGKKNQMYILTLEQCKQVLMRESKFVRSGYWIKRNIVVVLLKLLDIMKKWLKYFINY